MATGGISAAARLHSALSKPLYQRCMEIRKLLEDTGTKELHAVIPTLVESIFGFGSQPGWGIGRISKSSSYDFGAVRQLLHPDGPLLKLVYRLMVEPLRYEFPLSCLPFPVQKLIEEGSMPPLFAEGVQLNPNGRPYNILSLNAFEFYFYHFAYFLVSPQSHKLTPWTNPSEVLFTVVLEEYLNYFLPPDGRPLPVVPPTGSSMKSPMMQQSPRPTGLGIRATPVHAHSLLRSPAQRVLSPYASPMGSPVAMTTGVVEPGERETWRSRTFLQILVEFWLHQTSLELDKMGYMGISGTNTHGYTGWGYHGQLIDPYQYMLVESFLPSGDHVRVVRILVKHLHYFTNSANTDIIHTPYSPHNAHPWDDFKRSVFPQLVKKKLYGFLKHSFERWPLDASFRLILETWLSFLQPWRYTDPAQSNRLKEQDVKEKSVDERWSLFVVENLLFYAVLFHCFLQRIYKTELSAPKNAYILFRVTKVFSLPNLRDIIEDAECVLYESIHQMAGPMSPIHDMGASYLSPVSRRHGNLASVLANQMSELEGPGFKYIPIFCADSITLVQQLHQSILQAKETGAVSAAASGTSSSSFLSFLGFGSEDYNTSRYYGDGYDDMSSGGDWRKVDMHLTQATTNLCQIFQLTAPEKSEKGVKWGVSPPGSITPQHLPPDVDQTEEGPQIGPLARYQLMNGLRKFEVEYQGDPDLQPIRSFESPWLVRMLHHVATYFNTRYQQEFNVLYNRDDFTGRLSKVFLSPPTLIRTPEKLKALSPVAQQKQQLYHHPRLSLRWLATYRIIVSILVLYVVTFFMFGTGPVGFMLSMLLLTFVFASYRAFMMSIETRIS